MKEVQRKEKALGPKKKEEGVKMKSRSGDEPRKFDADILR
jgi:hypothetical protein